MNSEVEMELAALKAFAGEVAISPKDAAALVDESHVTAEDFTLSHARAMWAAMEAKARAGEQLDVVALAVRLPTVPRAFVAEVLMTPELGVAAQRLAVVRERS